MHHPHAQDKFRQEMVLWAGARPRQSLGNQRGSSWKAAMAFSVKINQPTDVNKNILFSKGQREKNKSDQKHRAGWNVERNCNRPRGPRFSCLGQGLAIQRSAGGETENRDGSELKTIKKKQPTP